MTSPVRAGGPHRDALTLALYASVLCGAMVQGGLGALLPYLALDLPMSHTVESLHVTGLAVGGIVASALAERSRRRFGRGPVLVAGVLSCALGAAVLAAAPSPFVSAGGMPFVGFGLTSTLIAGQVLAVARHGRHGPRVLGELNASYGVGAVVAAFALPIVATGLGWRWFAGAPAVLLLAVVLPLVVLGVRGAGTDAAVPAPPGGPPPAGRARTALVVMLLCVSAEWAFLFWFATHLTTVGGLATAEASAATAAMWVAVLVGRVAGSRLLGRVPPGRLLVASLLLGTVALVGLSVVTTPGPAVLTGVVAGLAAANLYGVSIAYVIAADPVDADAAVARGSLLAGLSLVVAPLAMGAAADVVGLGTAFAVLVTAGTAGALVLLLRADGADRAHPRRDPAHPARPDAGAPLDPAAAAAPPPKES